MNTDETPILRFECPLDTVAYVQPAKRLGKAPTIEMRIVAVLPTGYRHPRREVGALLRGVTKSVLAKLNPQSKLTQARKEALREAAGALSSVGALSSYTETTIPRRGWYWFVAKHGYRVGGPPRFVCVDNDNIKYAELNSRKYAGTYRGPINPEALCGK